MIPTAQRAQLILETTLRVVRLLPIYVQYDGIHIRRADGEQAIPALPCETGHSLPLHPSGRARLDLRNYLCRDLRGRQAQGDVDMIGNTANANTLTTKLANGSSDVRMKRQLDIIVDERHPAFGAEDNMHEVEAQRLRRVGDFISGFQPSAFARPEYLGLPPVGLGCNVVGPSGLRISSQRNTMAQPQHVAQQYVTHQ